MTAPRAEPSRVQPSRGVSVDTDSTVPIGGTAAPPTTTDVGASGAPAPGSPPRERTAPIPELVSELRDLVVAYVKQETIAPLTALGRWVAWGIAGSLFLGFGVVFLAMAGLRVLQDETGETFTGNWSWVPYVIVVFALGFGA